MFVQNHDPTKRKSERVAPGGASQRLPATGPASGVTQQRIAMIGVAMSGDPREAAPVRSIGMGCSQIGQHTACP